MYFTYSLAWRGAAGWGVGGVRSLWGRARGGAAGFRETDGGQREIETHGERERQTGRD